MKFNILATFLALTSISSSATVISVNGISPQGSGDGDGNGQKLLGTTNIVGAVVSSAVNGAIPVNPTGSTVNNSTYNITISNLDLSTSFAGATNVTVTFNLALLASAGDGLIVNGGANRTWVVDDSGLTNSGTNDVARFSTGETITFAVSDVNFFGTSGSITGVSFAGFTGTVFNLQPPSGIAGTFNTSTGLATGAGGTSFSPDNAPRLDSISLNLSVVPEPSTVLLGGLSLLALLHRRR